MKAGLKATAWLCGWMVAASAGWAHSAIVISTESATNLGFDASASGSDLANQGQPTFSSFTSTTTPTFGFGKVNDGIASTSTGTSSFYRDSEMPADLAFNLNTSTNTLGYDITTVRSIAGWSGSNQSQANQIWQLWTRQIGAGGYEYVGEVSYTPFAAGGSGDYLTRVTVTDDTGVIASNVEAVMLAIEPINAGGGNPGTVYREIDVEGTPSLTPPPATPANLIENPSFETPALSSGYQLFTTSSQFDAANWPINGEVTLVRGQFGTVASEGAQWLSLESNSSAPFPNNVGSVSQTFDTTPGMAYVLSFDYNALGNSSVTTPWNLTYDLGGPATAVSIPNPPHLTLGEWRREAVKFVATGPTTTVTFLGEAKVGGFYGPGIDNVSVSAALPEPSTMLLAVVGVVGMAFCTRRKRR